MKAYKKIVLAGGSGYLGTVLAKYYKDLANEVIILARKQAPAIDNIRTVVWDGKTENGWTVQLAHADMLINLCGKNVNCRYTTKNKARIISSRVVPTKLLGNVIHKMSDPPKLWINLASATIYRHAEDHPQDEATGQIGSGFSIEVCKTWESAFFQSETPHTRKVALRMGIALGKSGSVLPRLLNLVKMGIGGKQGNGRQYIAWVHEHDAARSTQYLLDHTQMEGIYNCTAPIAEKNADFMRILRETYGMPFGLPAPEWLLAIGATVIGTEPELILKSRWVMPQRLLDAGFTFLYEKADEAIEEILNTKE
jgi:uncharacterized protein (TIGR01777 family)